MTEQILSGGYFGDTVPAAPSSSAQRVVHGGYFGGVPVGAPPTFNAGWPGDEVALFVDCLQAFGGPCEYQPQGAAPYILANGAIFRASHTTVDMDSGKTVTTREPSAGALETEIPSTWTDQDIVIVPDRHGVSRPYRVINVLPDGEVGVRLRLHEVQP